MSKRKWPKPATSHRGGETSTVIVSNHDEGKCVADFVNEQDERAREATIQWMVSRFLSWRLPDTFSPDGGISFTKPARPEWWPVGTNVLDAVQADAMVRHLLGVPVPTSASDTRHLETK